LLVDHAHPDWPVTGLHRPSVINCSNIVFIHRRRISQVIGSLSSATMLQVNECLKLALALP
jgi:mRNA-degrading endonuclease toxin of MazEF toxin-antitoxin module